MTHGDPSEEALQWLTIDELAARRRDLVRELDRVMRHDPVDEDELAQILEDAARIERVQQERRRS